MKQFSSIVIISVIWLLYSCDSLSDKKEKTFGEIKSPEIVAKSNPLISENTIDDLREYCVRGQAEPITKNSVFPENKFELQPDSLTAIETIQFDNGDKLIINNWGCEYYQLTFRFETSRFQNEATNVPFWFSKSVQLINEVSIGIDPPIDIKKGIEKLNNHIEQEKLNNYSNLKFGQEIDFGGTEIRDFVTVEQIEQLSKKKFAITLSFTTGPL